MGDKFEKKFNQTFTEEEIELMKEHINEYKNPSNESFALAPFYYMTILRKIVSLSNH